MPLSTILLAFGNGSRSLRASGARVGTLSSLENECDHRPAGDAGRHHAFAEARR